MTNRRRLSLIAHYDISINTLANQWRKYVSTYLPNLTNFRFYISISSTNDGSSTNELLTHFHKEFWQKRK